MHLGSSVLVFLVGAPDEDEDEDEDEDKFDLSDAVYVGSYVGWGAQFFSVHRYLPKAKFIYKLTLLPSAPMTLQIIVPFCVALELTDRIGYTYKEGLPWISAGPFGLPWFSDHLSQQQEPELQAELLRVKALEATARQELEQDKAALALLRSPRYHPRHRITLSPRYHATASPRHLLTSSPLLQPFVPPTVAGGMHGRRGMRQRPG